MAGANTLTYTDDDVSSLFKSESQHRFDRRIAAVSDLLREKVGAEPYVFNYKRQKTESIRDKGAWGKFAVSIFHSNPQFGRGFWV
jgi:hypothetical protein